MKVITGGQTGVDRAALDTAVMLGIVTGGWCPAGRLAEDGPLPEAYPLEETPSSTYSQRTQWNVRDSDGTLILTAGAMGGGTALTARAAERAKKPMHIVDLDVSTSTTDALAWMAAEGIQTVNVAGPRESNAPGVYDRATSFLHEFFSALLAEAPG